MSDRNPCLLDADTILEWVDYVLEVIQPEMDLTDFMSSVTVLNHLVESELELHGEDQLLQGKKIERKTERQHRGDGPPGRWSPTSEPRCSEHEHGNGNVARDSEDTG